MQKCAHLVDLEKCCQTHVLLQNFVSIQPRTSLVKFAASPPWKMAARKKRARSGRAPGDQLELLQPARPHPGGCLATRWNICTKRCKSVQILKNIFKQNEYNYLLAINWLRYSRERALTTSLCDVGPRALIWDQILFLLYSWKPKSRRHAILL